MFMFDSEQWLGFSLKSQLQDMEITLKMMLSISKCINTLHLTTVGLFLSLTRSDIHHAEVAGKSTECAYQLLQKWKDIMGSTATVKNLLQCFLNAAQETAGCIDISSLTDALSKIQNDSQETLKK